MLKNDVPFPRRESPEGEVYDLLRELGIPFERLDHEAAPTIEACAAIDRELGTKMCKNLFLCNRQQTCFYLLMMPGDKPFKTKELSSQLGCARLSFADEARMLELLRIRPGAVSVMGLMNDREGRVRLLIDRDLMRDEFVGCHPCVNTASLKLRWEDVLHVFLPKVGHEPAFVELTGRE